MRFMIIRKADQETEAGAMPSDALVEAMGRYIDALADAGAMKLGEGLKPSAQGFRVRFADGVPSVIDGPFTESKELVAGVTIIDVPSREEALAWARRWPTEDGGGNVELEVRPLWEIRDFGDSDALERLERAHDRIGSP
jgi:hypothetical protein